MLVSLQRQTFENFEVICILDAPTDNSAQIVKEFASHDERFRVIENETNLHAGMSRNVGLDNAKGEFIGFVDADDECLPNMYEVLYTEAVSKNADYIISQPTLVKGEKTTSYQIPNTIDVLQIRNSLILRGGRQWISSFGFLHNGLYRKSLLDKFHLRFVDTKKYAPEDSLFNLSVSLSTDRIVFVNQSLYLYSVHEQSLSHGKSATSSTGMFNREKIMRSMDLWYAVLKEYNALDGYEIRLAKTILPYRLYKQQFNEYAPKSCSFFMERLKEKGAFFFALKTSLLYPPQKQSIKQKIKVIIKGILYFYEILSYFRRLQMK